MTHYMCCMRCISESDILFEIHGLVPAHEFEYISLTHTHTFGCEFRHHNQINEMFTAPIRETVVKIHCFCCYFVLKFVAFLFVFRSMPSFPCLIFPLTQEERQNLVRNCVCWHRGHEIKLPCHCWPVNNLIKSFELLDFSFNCAIFDRFFLCFWLLCSESNAKLTSIDKINRFFRLKSVLSKRNPKKCTS